MEKNPITNTLFRFVGFRGPQLADPKVTPTRYVYQPASLKRGIFYDAVANRPDGTTKMEALQNALSDFVNPFKSERDIQGLEPSLYDFSVWIARNKTTYTNAELQSEAKKVSKGLNDTQSGLLWDNFFYQMVSQSSFYTKEAIVQMLIADHAYKLLDKDAEGHSELNDDLLNASITLPPELFSLTDDTVAEESVDDSTKPLVPNTFFKRKLVVTEQKVRIRNYNSLKDELQQLEADYNKEYGEKYEIEYKKYEESIAPKLEEYDEAVEAARKAYCSVHNPAIPYDRNDPCQRPDYVPYPHLPEFVFEFPPQVDPEKIKTQLSPRGFAALLWLLSQNGKFPSVERLFRNYETYQSIYPLIDKALDAAHKKIATNASAYKKQVNINGISIPVAIAGVLEPFRFNIFDARVDLSSVFTLAIGLPDDSWQIININAVVTDPENGTLKHRITMPNAVPLEGSLLLNGFYTHDYGDKLRGDLKFDFDIEFSNGVIKTIRDVYALQGHGYEGLAIGDEKGRMSARTAVTASNNIPSRSGMGYRGVGTADYLRLEQTVQCYVEGEVSHIENIMAREYKEKATRVLRRSEETTTTSSETEEEKLSDTTTANRFEMQSEINKVISQSKDLSGYVSAGMSGASYSVNAGVNYASNENKTNSIRQATTLSKEITERAMDRVVQKIKEERIVKILEEYEENNKHGFDNRQGSNHVVGVYRWVDKLYKNQIMNYGSRMMLEFMVPEPGALHLLGMTVTPDGDDPENGLVEPKDPRTYIDEDYRIENSLDLDSSLASYWAGIYNVEIEAKPETQIGVGESFNIKWDNAAKLDKVESNAGNGKVTIPEGYKAISAVGLFTANSDNDSNTGAILSLTVGNRNVTYEGKFSTKRLYLNTAYSSTQSALITPSSSNTNYTQSFADAGYVNEVPVSYILGNHVSGDISVSVKCTLTDEGLAKWQQKTFKAIIDAYEEVLAAYKEKVAALQAATNQELATNPGFFRQIENTVLRKNCISYLFDRNSSIGRKYGRNMVTNADSFENYEVDLSAEANLNDYASFIQFMEQAFEWEIMSYNFYPYYWGNRSRWGKLYRYNATDDPTFRAFMQSGMARVIVTVRPGFEDAVALYLSSEILWNGGHQPVMGEDMFVSLVDEAKRPKAEPYGKAWLTRVPTSLTILQADSIGLKVEKALPCECGNGAEFEEGTVLPCGSNFEITNSQIGQNQAKKIRFSFVNIDHYGQPSYYTIGTYDERGLFPRIYECMGQIITIDRDASWQPEDSVQVVFEKLAAQLSLITGVQAEQKTHTYRNAQLPDGIEFTVDTSVNPDFVFIKKTPTGGWDSEFDMLRAVTSNGNVRMIYSTIYIADRVLDKTGVPLQSNEADTLLPIGRFSV